jgi:MFS family permease
MTVLAIARRQIADYRSVLQARNYRLLWMAMVVSAFGDRLSQIAMASLVFALTGSQVAIGVSLCVTVLPGALFGLLAGAAADRYSRKTLLVATDVVRAGLVLWLALATRLPITTVYFIMALHATATVFFTPTRAAALPDLVGEQRLMTANALDETSQNALDPIAYVIGGALIALIGVHVSFGLDAATFAVSGALIAATVSRRAGVWRTREHTNGRHLLAGVGEGLRFIRQQPTLRANTALFLLATLVACAEAPLTYMMVFLRWHRGALGLGITEALLAVGIVAGGLLYGVITTRFGRGITILYGLMGTAVCFMLVAVLPFWPAAFVIGLSGVFNILFYVPTLTLQQELAPNEIRARVLASRRTLTAITIFLSYAMATGLVNVFTPASVLGVLGGLLLGISVYGFHFRELRRH